VNFAYFNDKLSSTGRTGNQQIAYSHTIATGEGDALRSIAVRWRSQGPILIVDNSHADIRQRLVGLKTGLIESTYHHSAGNGGARLSSDTAIVLRRRQQRDEWIARKVSVGHAFRYRGNDEGHAACRTGGGHKVGYVRLKLKKLRGHESGACKTVRVRSGDGLVESGTVYGREGPRYRHVGRGIPRSIFSLHHQRRLGREQLENDLTVSGNARESLGAEITSA
jgi:hypothetical protein